MAPWQVLIWLIAATVTGLIGWRIGVYKGRPGWGFWLSFLLGLIGIVITACLSRTESAKVKSVAENLRIQQEAQRQAGYPYPQEPWSTPAGPMQERMP